MSSSLYPEIEINPTEKNTMIPFLIKRFKLKHKILPKDMVVADYRIAEIYIELKASLKDAVRSMETGRFNNQAFDLSASLRCSWIFILGNPQVELKDAGFKLNSFIANCVSLALRHASKGKMGHINMITVYSEIEFVYWLKHLQKRALDFTPREPQAEKLRKFSRDPEYAIPFMLESTPDLGPTLTRSLLAEFGSIERVINATVERLQTVPKIGKKKAQKYHDFWRMDWRDYHYRSEPLFIEEFAEEEQLNVFKSKE